MHDLHVQQLRGSASTTGPGKSRGGFRSGNLNGVEVSPDVDDVNRLTALRVAVTKGEHSQLSVQYQVPRPRGKFNVRTLDLQQLARHAKLSGDQREVLANSLKFLRQRLLRPKTGQQRKSATSAWKLAGNRPAMRQYLALQKMQTALKLQQAARQERKSEEEAEEEFMAAMAPLADNPGNASGLAQKFYDALGRDADLEDLLSGFEDSERTVLLEELRGCAVIEEYDPKQKAYRNTFDRRQFSAALKRAMRLDGFHLTDEKVRDLLEDVQGELAEMEGDPEFGRYAMGALNIVDYAEELQSQGEDGLQFIDDYSELVHADASMANMLSRASQIWVPGEGHIDMAKVRMTMEAASRAANLDMESTYPSTTDKNHLWAAVQSTKLIARLSTAIMLAYAAGDFLNRHFGRHIDPSKLLRELLDRMANPNAPASEFLAMTARINLQGDAMPAALKEAGDFFRTMHDMYPDPKSRQSLLKNLLDAMDEAARLEDERLSEEDSADIIPIVKPIQQAIPTAQQGTVSWTGFTKR